MKTLDQIFIENGTDKGSKHRAFAHNYSSHYEKFFEPRRGDALRFCEMGVENGESIKAWLEYFTNPSVRIFGGDIGKDSNPWNRPSNSPDARYSFINFNQEDDTSVKCFLSMCGGALDIVVDDACHTNTGIATAFEVIWPAVLPGGLYCIEDLHSGYGTANVHTKPGRPDHKTWLHALVDFIHTSDNEMDFIYFSHELAIIRKKE